VGIAFGLREEAVGRKGLWQEGTRWWWW